MSEITEQVDERGLGASSEYVRELIRKDADHSYLRSLLLKGVDSTPAAPVDASYFRTLRERVQKRSRG